LTPQATGLSAISLSLDERGRKMLDWPIWVPLLIGAFGLGYGVGEWCGAVAIENLWDRTITDDSTRSVGESAER
jgi:hypothetical protein